MLNYQEDAKDLWLVFEVCGKPLSKAMYEVKGEFYKGERIYSVGHDPTMYTVLERDNNRGVKILLEALGKALDLLSLLGIVHGDLKAENVLVETDPSSLSIRSVKIIDLGSAFFFDQLRTDMQLSTPEYLPPEVLNFLESRFSTAKNATSSLQK